MKQALTEALAEHDRLTMEPVDYEYNEDIVAAARLVERLLPGKCEHGSTEPHKLAYGSDERYCDGQVWDEGIVEAVAEAVKAEGGWHNWRRSGLTLPGADLPDSFFNDIARAVLSALVELLTEKVPE